MAHESVGEWGARGSEAEAGGRREQDGTWLWPASSPSSAHSSCRLNAGCGTEAGRYLTWRLPTEVCEVTVAANANDSFSFWGNEADAAGWQWIHFNQAIKSRLGRTREILFGRNASINSSRPGPFLFGYPESAKSDAGSSGVGPPSRQNRSLQLECLRSKTIKRGPNRFPQRRLMPFLSLPAVVTSCLKRSETFLAKEKRSESQFHQCTVSIDKKNQLHHCSQ